MLRLVTLATSNLNGGQRLFVFVCILVACAVVLLLLGAGDIWTRAAVFALCPLLLWFGASAATPPEISRDRLRRYSMYVAWAVSVAVLAAGDSWQVLVLKILDSRYGLFGGKIPDSTAVPATLVLAVAWIGVVTLNWIWRDRTTTGKFAGPFEEHFPERSFAERLRLICDDLRNDL